MVIYWILYSQWNWNTLPPDVNISIQDIRKCKSFGKHKILWTEVRKAYEEGRSDETLLEYVHNLQYIELKENLDLKKTCLLDITLDKISFTIYNGTSFHSSNSNFIVSSHLGADRCWWHTVWFDRKPIKFPFNKWQQSCFNMWLGLSLWLQQKHCSIHTTQHNSNI